MLEISSLDLSKIFKTSSIGANGTTQQPQKEKEENALLSFDSPKTNISDDDIKKLEDEFLSAANNIGLANPFSEKNTGTDSLERDKEQKIDEIKKTEEEINSLVSASEALSSNISEQNKENESKIRIGENNGKDSISNSNLFTKHSEAIEKQETAKKKNLELGSLIKEAESLDIEIATKSTCGEQGKVPDIKENSRETNQVKNQKEKQNEDDDAKTTKTPQEIALEQIDLLARLFPEMENKSNNVGEYKDTHQKNIMDLEATMQILRRQAESLPSADPNSSYIQRQKALFLGLTS